MFIVKLKFRFFFVLRPASLIKKLISKLNDGDSENIVELYETYFCNCDKSIQSYLEANNTINPNNVTLNFLVA